MRNKIRRIFKIVCEIGRPLICYGGYFWIIFNWSKLTPDKQGVIVGAIFLLASLSFFSGEK